jgi:ABC-type Mn2+/Zn2+ transport system permease subunit
MTFLIKILIFVSAIVAAALGAEGLKLVDPVSSLSRDLLGGLWIGGVFTLSGRLISKVRS